MKQLRCLRKKGGPFAACERFFTDHLNTGGNPMNDESQINQVLIQELASLRERISELEEELRESEEKYRNILENIEDVYFEVDRAGDFTFFNPSLCRILGYTREEMLGTNYKVLMDAENAKKVFQVFSEVYVTGIPARGFEWEVIKKDGAKAYFEVLISLIVKPGEKPTRFRGIARDITERKRMEEKL
jgi:PAS domain S-box-containing protein